MPAANGTAYAEADDPLDLGDLLPRMKQVTIIRDGQKVTLDAYEYETAPVSVYALIAQAHDEFAAVWDDQTVRGLHRSQALAQFHKSIAKALVIGMTHAEADNLGGDMPKLERLLKALGYPPERKADDAGEAPAAGSATESSSPASEPSTATPTPIG